MKWFRRFSKKMKGMVSRPSNLIFFTLLLLYLGFVVWAVSQDRPPPLFVSTEIRDPETGITIRTITYTNGLIEIIQEDVEGIPLQKELIPPATYDDPEPRKLFYDRDKDSWVEP